MTKKKAKKKATVKKIKVVKVVPVEPDRCLVGLELEIENGAPIPTEPLPTELELAAPAEHKENSWVAWIKGLWE
jgi:hypothetical protein